MNNRSALNMVESDYHDDLASLTAHQERQASLLNDAHRRTIEAIDRRRIERLEALRRFGEKSDAVDQLRDAASTALSDAYREFKATLSDLHLTAAEKLKSAQDKAASVLRRTKISALEQHQEKDEVIAWMSGEYSVRSARE